MTLARIVEERLLRAWRPRHRSLQRVAAVISETSRGGALWFVLSAMFVPRQTLRRGGRDGLAAWALASSLAFAVKAGVNRRRPALPGRGPTPKSSSMPSSHTAGAIVYAVAATAAAPGAGFMVAPAALGVAWSRVASQRHFPSDVAVGAGLGVAAGVAVAVVMSRVDAQGASAAPAAYDDVMEVDQAGRQGAGGGSSSSASSEVTTTSPSQLVTVLPMAGGPLGLLDPGRERLELGLTGGFAELREAFGLLFLDVVLHVGLELGEHRVDLVGGRRPSFRAARRAP